MCVWKIFYPWGFMFGGVVAVDGSDPCPTLVKSGSECGPKKKKKLS